ncbi:hypothetical protein RC54_23515 [Herbaspirillum rubrisubalbicans]|uniref:Uncharacterized protein n=1 Tax=Herbaspirillum rubrisubalbicans TaxID=80842 RepID=A0AAD0UGH7_9BURK|nr:hypothetical protein RC54_23515 [Herbaspirillum rubrisubalbicans]
MIFFDMGASYKKRLSVGFQSPFGETGSAVFSPQGKLHISAMAAAGISKAASHLLASALETGRKALPYLPQ